MSSDNGSDTQGDINVHDEDVISWQQRAVVKPDYPSTQYYQPPNRPFNTADQIDSFHVSIVTYSTIVTPKFSTLMNTLYIVAYVLAAMCAGINAAYLYFRGSSEEASAIEVSVVSVFFFVLTALFTSIAYQIGKRRIVFRDLSANRPPQLRNTMV